MIREMQVQNDLFVAACLRSLRTNDPPAKDIPGRSTTNWNSTNIQTIHIHPNKLIILFITIYIM